MKLLRIKTVHEMQKELLRIMAEERCVRELELMQAEAEIKVFETKLSKAKEEACQARFKFDAAERALEDVTSLGLELERLS
jgi:hypothetical protein